MKRQPRPGRAVFQPGAGKVETRWWNLSHSPKSAHRSRVIREMSAQLVSEVGRTTTHSARAATLPLVIETLEAARAPYMIYAIPGQGYVVKRVAVLPEVTS